MLTSEELKPEILHEDRWIRAAALHHFTKCRSADPEIARLALTAHERFFQLGELPSLHSLNHLVIDAGALERVLALLDSTPSRVVVTHLNWCLTSLPLVLIREQGRRIDDHPRLTDETRAALEHRRRFGDLPDAAAWEELLKLSGRAKLRPVPIGRDPRAVCLVDELAGRPIPNDEEVCSFLGSAAFQETYFEALMVKLAGVRRMKAAAPILVSMLGREENDGLSYRQEALAMIGVPEIAGMIRSLWEFLDHGEASGVLESIPHPAAEESLLELFEEEDDPQIRFYLAKGLCNLFSAGAVEPALRVIREKAAFGIQDLQEALLPVIDLLKIDVPESEPWRKRREEKLARRPDVEKLCPEALEIHRQLLAAVAELNQAAEMRDEAYRQMERLQTEPAGDDEGDGEPSSG